MRIRSASIPLVFVAGAVALGLSLSGCSSTPGAHTTKPVHVGAAHACKLVSPELIKSTLGFNPGKGVESKGQDGAGSTKCDYTRVSVEVSLQASTYTPKQVYNTSQAEGSVKLNPSTGADYGFIAPKIVFVAKGNTSIYVDIVEGPGNSANQILAKGIIDRL